MTITDLVAPEAILPALKVNSKKQALQELAAKAAELSGQNERSVFEVLLQAREARHHRCRLWRRDFPHGKLPKLEKAVRPVLRGWNGRLISKRMDGQPVDLIFLLAGGRKAPAGPII